MAFINPITLTITPVPNSSDRFVLASYGVQAEDPDVNGDRKYSLICEIIGDDTPGDGQDDVLATWGPETISFSGTAARYQKINEFRMSNTALDEDQGFTAFDRDEIRARVTLTALPFPAGTSSGSGTALAPTGEKIIRESNQIVIRPFLEPVVDQ